jgi:hypothetical protein
VDVHFAHYQQAKRLAESFLTKLLAVVTNRFYVRHDDFDRFWRGLEKKALKSEAEREFQDALRDAKHREEEERHRRQEERQQEQEWRLTELRDILLRTGADAAMRQPVAVSEAEALDPTDRRKTDQSLKHHELFPLKPGWDPELHAIVLAYLSELLEAGIHLSIRALCMGRVDRGEFYKWIKGEKKQGSAVDETIRRICQKDKPHLKTGGSERRAARRGRFSSTPHIDSLHVGAFTL